MLDRGDGDNNAATRLYQQRGSAICGIGLPTERLRDKDTECRAHIDVVVRHQTVPGGEQRGRRRGTGRAGRTSFFGSSSRFWAGRRERLGRVALRSSIAAVSLTVQVWRTMKGSWMRGRSRPAARSVTPPDPATPSRSPTAPRSQRKAPASNRDVARSTGENIRHVRRHDRTA